MGTDLSYYRLSEAERKLILSLKGPIIVFGAGGFIGVNLLLSLLAERKDVFGISQDHLNNWRLLAAGVPLENLHSCDINDTTQLKDMLDELKPQTIFNLAAYGAYSKQREYKKIHETNYNSTLDILEQLKGKGFSSYVHAGSSAEYGLNPAGPSETEELVPNSHYAVSKAAVSLALKYYGKVESLPVTHLRLYSAYGPWEEPDRLFPVLLAHARSGSLPPLVQPDISRDFIYVNDISTAFIHAAAAKEQNGESYNIGTGIRTTIRDLVEQVREMCNVQVKPEFGNMPNRSWDMKDWFANPRKAKTTFSWNPEIGLPEGIRKTIEWQEKVGFDTAFWNWTRKQ